MNCGLVRESPQNPLKRFRGRCQPVKVKQFPLTGLVRKAWQGHYNPDFETQSCTFKRFVRQARRITSIKHRVAKLDHFDVIWHRTIEDILQEWHTISHTVLNGEPFWYWMSQIPELCPVPDHIPTYDWLHLLEQFVHHHLQLLAAQEKTFQKNMRKWNHRVDCKDKGKKQAFAVAKGVGTPPFTRILTTAQSQGILAATQNPKHFEVFVHDADQFTPYMSIEANGFACQVVGLTADSVVIKVPDDFNITNENVDLVQQATQSDINIIFSKLWEYWNQFWKRDEGGEDYVAEHDDYLCSLKSFLPQIPPFPEFCENDINLWKEAIRRSKQRSAPGSDGVTFEELKLLPDSFVQALADVLTKIEHFPEELMWAKTVPLPKTCGIPKASESRPITILPTCYRLWARVTCAPVLQYLSNLLPPEITGMLPRRGVISARYDFRTLLEIARHDNRELTGITLDLRKCFNLIHRDKAKQLLLAWGLPQLTIEKWFRSLNLVRRFWEIQGQSSRSEKSCTGCPEGDSWSVIVMLVIAASWSTVLCGQHSSIGATAYADNWTFWSQLLETHPESLQHTVQFTKWLGLEVDCGKTWRWSTSKQLVKQLDESLKPFAGEVTTAPPNAWDLGAPISYRGFTKLGPIADRLVKGKERLSRIMNAPWELSVKIHIINSSVYMQAFHGCESVVIGQSLLDNFRSCVANALLGTESHSANPAIILQCASPSIFDPHLFTILQSLKEARRFLLQSSPDIRAKFLFLASRPQTLVGTSKGPASALREYLLRVGWYLDRQGNVQVTGLITLNILQCSFKRLKSFLIDAWQAQLLVMHTQRAKLHSLPPISRGNTMLVLEKSQANLRLHY